MGERYYTPTIEDSFVIIIDGKAYNVYYETDLLIPVEYEYV